LERFKGEPMTIYDLDKIQEWINMVDEGDIFGLMASMKEEVQKIEKEADDMTAKLNTREK
jgi:hypothetical protein